ncbi:MAG: hypothetical protein GY820_31865 [Gammaproteobacteria bacterium]|nr:hypothetical protein [Gammaproteobacteria bacterium]
MKRNPSDNSPSPTCPGCQESHRVRRRGWQGGVANANIMKLKQSLNTNQVGISHASLPPSAPHQVRFLAPRTGRRR